MDKVYGGWRERQGNWSDHNWNDGVWNCKLSSLLLGCRVNSGLFDHDYVFFERRNELDEFQQHRSDHGADRVDSGQPLFQD